MAEAGRLGTALCRRKMIAGGSAATACAMARPAGAAAPERQRPTKGDRLVIDAGEHKGEPARPDLLPAGGPPVAALPVDPETGSVRDGSRLNKVLLLRLDAGELDEQTRAHAAEGVLAYSAVCTHQGCTVSGWLAPERVLACFCHESKFSATEAGKVVGGPSRARLPILPLAVVDGALVVADGFTSKPGPKL